MIHQYKKKVKRHYLREFRRLVREKIERRESGSVSSASLFGGPSLSSSFDIAPSLAGDRSRFTVELSSKALTRDQLEYDRDLRMNQMDATYEQCENLKKYVKDKKAQMVQWSEGQVRLSESCVVLTGYPDAFSNAIYITSFVTRFSCGRFSSRPSVRGGTHN